MYTSVCVDDKMAAMSVQFLLTICVTGILGHMVRNKLDPGNPGPQSQDLDVGNPPQQWQDPDVGSPPQEWQDLDVGNPPQQSQDLDVANPPEQSQDLDVGNSPQQWQDLVTLVYGKIEGMEHIMAKKDERIDQLELNSASQMTEIMQLKRDMTSLEHTLLQKGEVIRKLTTRISDLETIVMLDSGEYESRQTVRSQLPKTKINETQVGPGKLSDSRSESIVWKMSTSPPSIPQTSTYQNGSSMPTHSKQHIENDDDHLLNQSDEGDTAVHTDDEAEYISMSKLSRFQQKRVTPRTTVAFHVALSNNKVVTNDDVVVYDHETLDQGDGYNPGEGLYTTPGSGTYVITWTILCYPHNLFQTVLVVNGAVRGSSWTDAEQIDDYHQTTAVVVLTLNQGDHVFIRMGHTYGHGAIRSGGTAGLSTFSGWKLD